jgi:hypothetical protein
VRSGQMAAGHRRRDERERGSQRNEGGRDNLTQLSSFRFPPWACRPPADRLLALHGDVVYCSHLVKVEEPAAGYPVRIPVAPAVARRAMDLVRQFPGCFWFRDEEAQVRYRDDVELVVKHLREYGDKTTWEAAKELRRCL